MADQLVEVDYGNLVRILKGIVKQAGETHGEVSKLSTAHDGLNKKVSETKSDVKFLQQKIEESNKKKAEDEDGEGGVNAKTITKMKEDMSAVQNKLSFLESQIKKQKHRLNHQHGGLSGAKKGKKLGKGGDPLGDVEDGGEVPFTVPSSHFPSTTISSQWKNRIDERVDICTDRLSQLKKDVGTLLTTEPVGKDEFTLQMEKMEKMDANLQILYKKYRAELAREQARNRPGAPKVVEISWPTLDVKFVGLSRFEEKVRQLTDQLEASEAREDKLTEEVEEQKSIILSLTERLDEVEQLQRNLFSRLGPTAMIEAMEGTSKVPPYDLNPPRVVRVATHADPKANSYALRGYVDNETNKLQRQVQKLEHQIKSKLRGDGSHLVQEHMRQELESLIESSYRKLAEKIHRLERAGKMTSKAVRELQDDVPAPKRSESAVDLALEPSSARDPPQKKHAKTQQQSARKPTVAHAGMTITKGAPFAVVSADGQQYQARAPSQVTIQDNANHFRASYVDPQQQDVSRRLEAGFLQGVGMKSARGPHKPEASDSAQPPAAKRWGGGRDPIPLN